MRALVAQSRAELRMTMRRGESVLLALGIPVLLLGFFSVVEVLPTGEQPVRFLFPGIVALAVMSTAMVSTAIATGFERQYGVLKRLQVTPLGRPRLLAAKIAGILAVEALQVVVLTVEAVALGYKFGGLDLLAAAAAIVLATIAFTGLGMTMAGTLPAFTTLAAANGLYLVLLLLSGMLIPLDELPSWLAAIARLLPSAALADSLRAALGASGGSATPWIVLVAWAAAAPSVAAWRFRWD